MDWSLVLASQGIEHTVEHEELLGWFLAVAPADRESALHQIRQYRLENRHWHWRQRVLSPELFFDWRCLGWLGLIVAFHIWAARHEVWRAAGEMRGDALAKGEWWRLFTATWLHADLGHVTMNAVWGWLFMGLVMGRYGAGFGLLAAYLAGAAGNIFAGWVHGASMRGLGASGVVMGALGLLTVPSGIHFKQLRVQGFRLALSGILAGVLLFVLTGTNPESDVVAHLSGLVTGWFLGVGLVLIPKNERASRWQNVAGLIYLILVVLPWWLAIRSVQ